MTHQISLIEIVQDYLASNALTLPVFNRAALELQRMISGEDFSIEKCAALVIKDQTLASQVLREANSSFYGGLKKINTIKDAMVRLGAKEVLRLTMMVAQQGQYTCRNSELKGLMGQLWKHSLGVGLSSAWLAKKTGYQAQAAEAFMAGLLHDIGELFLLKVVDELCSKKKLSQMKEALIKEIFEVMHAEVGAQLMKQWGLPEMYGEVARWHHDHSVEKETSLLLMVQLADQTCYRLGIAHSHDPDIQVASTQEAQLLDIGETALAELEIMLEDKFFPKTT